MEWINLYNRKQQDTFKLVKTIRPGDYIRFKYEHSSVNSSYRYGVVTKVESNCIWARWENNLKDLEQTKTIKQWISYTCKTLQLLKVNKYKIYYKDGGDNND